MKLQFELPARDIEVFHRSKEAQERILYCIPFDFYEEKRVAGYMVFTQKSIYKILDGRLLEKYDFSHLSDFSVDVMFGVCGFFAKRDGISVQLCEFISGRNLARYSVIPISLFFSHWHILSIYILLSLYTIYNGFSRYPRNIFIKTKTEK
jgi:hypothetical protein